MRGCPTFAPICWAITWEIMLPWFRALPLSCRLRQGGAFVFAFVFGFVFASVFQRLSSFSRFLPTTDDQRLPTLLTSPPLSASPAET